MPSTMLDNALREKTTGLYKTECVCEGCPVPQRAWRVPGE